MAKFCKKPVVIEAVQWTGRNILEISSFMYPEEPQYVGKQFSNADELIGLDTKEGRIIASIGDWIIKGIKGELYPCKPDIFEATYEPVEDSHDGD